MDIIYDSSFNLAAIPAATTLAAAEAKTYTVGRQVDGWALLGSTGAVQVQASNDNFVTTVYDSGMVYASDVPSRQVQAVNAATWRVLAVTAASVGLLYVGTTQKTRDPTYPYSFERAVNSRDRQTLGGATWSISGYTARQGSWSINAIRQVEADAWRSLYDATAGFRRGFVVRVDGLVYLVKAPSKILLLDRIAPDVFSLQLPVEEIV